MHKLILLFIIFSVIIIALTIRAEGAVSESEMSECKLYSEEYIKLFPFSLQNENIAVDVIYERIQRKNRLENKESSESTVQT